MTGFQLLSDQISWPTLQVTEQAESGRMLNLIARRFFPERSLNLRAKAAPQPAKKR